MILKNSLKLLIISLLLLPVSLSAAKKRGEHATKNLKGQEYYLNRCSNCHGEASRGANMSSIREWKALFTKNASELIEIHLDDEENKDILSYFNSDDFKKEEKQMLKLLQEFAYDSEYIPTCN